MPEIVQTEHQLLDPETLARLNRLKMAVREMVEGLLSGQHVSPMHGASVEFAEHKEYVPGDDTRYIDWRAYARADRYMIKRFEAETNLRSYMLLDASGSMNYGSGKMSKLEAAQRLAAAISYLLLKQQDSVGVLAFGGRSDPRVLLPSAGLQHLPSVLRMLATQQAEGETALETALQLATERLPRRGFIALFSDLLADEQKILPLLRQLTRRNHRVAVFHILDEDELSFPFEDPTRFVDLEIDSELTISPRQLRDEYLQQMSAFIERCKKSLTEARIDYYPVNTAEPLDKPLNDFLKTYSQ